MERARPAPAEEVLDRVRERWPQVPFDRALVDRALERGGADGVKHPEELCLAFACAQGDTAAQVALDREVVPGAARIAARLSPSAEFADEVAQALRTRLFLADPKRAARIGDYDGSTSLVTWVRVVARHAAIDLLRGRPRAPAAGGEQFERLIEPSNPEQDLAQDRFKTEFRKALSEAMKTLESRDRAALRLHFGEGVPLEGVAAAYGVHRATAARWIATARATVLGRTKRNLARILGANEAEVESILREARNELDVSISTLFRSSKS